MLPENANHHTEYVRSYLKKIDYSVLHIVQQIAHPLLVAFEIIFIYTRKKIATLYDTFRK